MDESLFHIQAKESGERIDALLARTVADLTRSGAQRLLEDGCVSLDGAAVKKNYKVRAGDLFTVELPPPADLPLIPQALPLDIVFEDEDVIVVNKARGMVVHPAPGHPVSGIGGEKRPGIVHRIDKDTSGLLIVAKNDFAHQQLSAQLADRSLSRVYEAVVHGSFREDAGTIDRPIGRHPTDRKRMAVTEKNSRSAVTHWQVLTRYRGFTHIRCKLETGRTHQIRVHMASLGHPLLGDFTYGAPSPEKGLEGQCLHARCLQVIHPRSGAAIRLESELPPYFRDVLGKLGQPIEEGGLV